MDRDTFTFADFKALPFKKKVNHVLYYYKWYIVGGIALVCLLISLITTIADNQKEVLVSGIFINNATSQEGYDHLQQDYWTFCGSDKNTRVDLVTGRTINFNSETLSQEDAASFMVVTSMIAARTLDYIITDEDSLDDFMGQEIILDLKEILPEQELAALDTIELDGITAAIRLESSEFARNYPLAAEKSVLLIAGCTQDFQKDATFIRYVMGNGNGELAAFPHPLQDCNHPAPALPPLSCRACRTGGRNRRPAECGASLRHGHGQRNRHPSPVDRYGHCSGHCGRGNQCIPDQLARGIWKRAMRAGIGAALDSAGRCRV